MNKTYADECLDRANKATIGPWSKDLCIWDGALYSKNPDETFANAKFIASSRTDVVELANRLKRACARLRSLSYRGREDKFIAELEASPGDK